MKSSSSDRRIPGLDGLRAVAVALVLLNHVLLQRLFWETAWYGQLGVTLFFVLSGFLISQLLLAEHAATGSIAVGSFFARRALRILPVWFTYVAVIALAGALHLLPQVSSRDVAAAVLFVRNMSGWASSPLLDHGWSLSIEEQFYLVWPLVLLALFALPRRGTALAGILVVVVTAPLWHAAFYVGVPDLRRFAAAPTPYHADALLWGCLLALALHAGWGERIAAVLCRPWVVLTSMLGALFVLPALVALLVPDEDLVAVIVVIGEPVQATLAAVILAAVLLRPGWPAMRLLGSRPVVGLGLASYSIYVWQQPFFLSDGLGPLSAFPLNLAGALALGAASYLVIERSSNRLRARLSRSPRPRAADQEEAEAIRVSSR